jgi:predicted metal-dependent hydrolase
VFRKLAPAYRDFYKDAFQPWQHNNLELIEQFRHEFEPPVSAAA